MSSIYHTYAYFVQLCLSLIGKRLIVSFKMLKLIYFNEGINFALHQSQLMIICFSNSFIQLFRTTLKQVLFSLIILTIFAKSTWSDEKFSDESPSASPDVGFGFESLKSWYDCVPGIQGSIGGKFLIFYPTGSFAKLYSFIFNFG